MKTGTMMVALAAVLLLSPAASAQTFSHLNIDIEGNVVSLFGGERGSVKAATDGVVIGRTTVTAISRRDNACGLFVGPSPDPQAVAVWMVEVTPLQVYASAVTFQLKWSRTRADQPEGASASGDLRVTLQPGQSLPVDSLPIPSQAKMPGGICDLKAMALRVAVGFWPRAADDTRLVNTELWLIEKLADRSERSQALTLKTGINQPTTFYFDPVTVSAMPFQMFGTLTLTPVGNTYSLTIDARYRPASPGSVAGVAADRQVSRIETMRLLLGSNATRRVESVINLTPGEVVEVQLPPLIAGLAGASTQTFSIRIRARQVQ